MGSFLALHGFSGAPESLSGLRRTTEEWFIPALLGHRGSEYFPGASLTEATPGWSETRASDPTPVQSALQPEWSVPSPRWGIEHGGFHTECDRLIDWAERRGFRRGHLLGYSLGARLALGMLARYPEYFTGATLIGVHPGLEDDQERQQRLMQDVARARDVRTNGVDAFMNEWERLPLWVTQRSLPPHVLSEQARIRRQHDAEGLACSLILCGLGAMPPGWHVLQQVRTPLTLITGALDEKFTALARRALASSPRVHHVTIADAGHNVVLEAPVALRTWLDEPVT